jgi:hypothetical protein
LRERPGGIIAKGETSGGESCLASVALEEPDAKLLLKSAYLKA